jgi:hypothetical protein
MQASNKASKGAANALLLDELLLTEAADAPDLPLPPLPSAPSDNRGLLFVLQTERVTRLNSKNNNAHSHNKVFREKSSDTYTNAVFPNLFLEKLALGCGVNSIRS